MGCCESRLLSIEGADNKYQICENFVEEAGMVGKKNLALVGLDKQNSNTEKNSLCTLRQKLSQVLCKFQKDPNPLSLTPLQKKPPVLPSPTPLPNPNPLQPSIKTSQIIPNVSEQYILDPLSMNSYTLTQQQQNSSYIQYERSQILSIGSLQSQVQLEKELFYINSSKIDGVGLLKWSEEGRRAVKCRKEGLMMGNVRRGEVNFWVGVYLIAGFEGKQGVSLFCCKYVKSGIGYRVYVNGTKRMLYIKSQTNQLSPSKHSTPTKPNPSLQNYLQSLPNPYFPCSPPCPTCPSLHPLPSYLPILQNSCLSFSTHILTGWIPQTLNLSKLGNIKQIFNRLTVNYKNNNILVTLASIDGLVIYVFNQGCLQGMYWRGVRIRVGEGGEMCDVGEEERYDMGVIMKECPIAHINWNPQIYTFTKKLQSTYNHHNKHPQYRLKIPASQTQVQIRILLLPHFTHTHPPNPSSPSLTFTVSLYQTTNHINIEQRCIPIRQNSNVSAYFLSQLFIFQKCQDISQYVLVVDVDYWDASGQNGDGDGVWSGDGEMQFSVEFYSFFPVCVQKLQQPALICKQSIVSQLRPYNAGFGMNSPFFSQNLHYSLTTPTLSHILLKLTTTLSPTQQTPLPKNTFIFQLFIVPDLSKQKDLSLVRPSQLANQIIHTEEYQNYAVFQFVPKWRNYIIVVVGYLAVRGKVEIEVEGYGDGNGNGNGNGKGERVEVENGGGKEKEDEKMEIQEIKFQHAFWKQIEFSWTQSSPGPRKRTCNNSQPIFYPLSTFQSFLQNPYIDLTLPPSFYQFSLLSLSFTSTYSHSSLQQNQQQYNLKLLKAVPPSIALAIFELNQDKTEMKIVLDDFEYVPYGIGFWTTRMWMSGMYRFVFSKIQVGEELGVFRVCRF